MRKFRINITLENAAKKDYTKLNQELKKVAIKTIRKNEYGFEGNISIIEVNGALLQAAQRIGKQFEFTVMREKVLRH